MSDGRSVIKNFIPLNSIRAGAGRISFCLMLIVVIKKITLENIDQKRVESNFWGG